MNSAQTVLILGARAPVTLDLVRSFGKKGWQVILGDSLRFPISRWSKYVHKFIRLPSPVDDPLEFKLCLQKVVQIWSVNLCIPTCEEAFHISMIKDELATEVFVDEIEVMERLHNKWQFSQEVLPHFKAPLTVLIKDFRDWTHAKNYVFKPIYSRFGAQTILNADQDFVKAKIKDSNSWIAQKKIKGKEVCVYSIWKNGVLQSFCLYHPKYRYKSGAGVYFEPVRNQAIYDAVKSYGEKLGFTGQLSFDFIIEEGIPYVLECNPRTTSGLHLLDYKLVNGFLGKSDMSEVKPIQAKTLKVALLVSNPFLLFSQDYWQSKDVIFSWADPSPFFMQITSLFELVYISLSRGISITESMTRDIAYNGHEDSIR